MRKILAAFLIFVVLWLGYIASPFVALFTVVRAAQAGDAAAIAQRADFPRLRRSFAVQILQAYAGLSGLRLDSASLTIGLGAALAEPFIEKLLTPAALAELLRSGWPKAALEADAPAGAEGLDPRTLGNAWQLYLNSDYGIGVVRIALPAGQPRERQFRIELTLSGWTWKLSGLELPAALTERLAREMVKQKSG